MQVTPIPPLPALRMPLFARLFTMLSGTALACMTCCRPHCLVGCGFRVSSSLNCQGLSECRVSQEASFYCV